MWVSYRELPASVFEPSGIPPGVSHGCIPANWSAESIEVRKGAPLTVKA
jgi:hypothetical protein